jgi:hypothetical protein
MKQEFIPYEQALELKELWFDEPCLGYWDDEKVFALNEEYLRGSQMDLTWITAPLYQQAFRWFREKYRLYSAVNVDQTMEPKFAYCISEYCSNALTYGWNTIVFNSDLYYTYEEAELECLKKLIEIVKNK